MSDNYTVEIVENSTRLQATPKERPGPGDYLSTVYCNIIKDGVLYEDCWVNLEERVRSSASVMMVGGQVPTCGKYFNGFIYIITAPFKTRLSGDFTDPLTDENKYVWRSTDGTVWEKVLTLPSTFKSMQVGGDFIYPSTSYVYGSFFYNSVYPFEMKEFGGRFYIEGQEESYTTTTGNVGDWDVTAATPVIEYNGYYYGFKMADMVIYDRHRLPTVIARSTDGVTWTDWKNCLELPNASYFTMAICEFNNTLFIGTYGTYTGDYYIVENPQNEGGTEAWNYHQLKPNADYVDSRWFDAVVERIDTLIMYNSKLYAVAAADVVSLYYSTEGRVVYESEDGISWTYRGVIENGTSWTQDAKPSSILVHNGTLFVGPWAYTTGEDQFSYREGPQDWIALSYTSFNGDLYASGQNVYNFIAQDTYKYDNTLGQFVPTLVNNNTQSPIDNTEKITFCVGTPTGVYNFASPLYLHRVTTVDPLSRNSTQGLLEIHKTIDGETWDVIYDETRCTFLDGLNLGLRAWDITEGDPVANQTLDSETNYGTGSTFGNIVPNDDFIAYFEYSLDATRRYLSVKPKDGNPVGTYYGELIVENSDNSGVSPVYYGANLVPVSESVSAA